MTKIQDHLNFSKENIKTLCPRFEHCSRNKCILSKDFNKLLNDPSDPAILHKQKCIPKSYRIKLARKLNLKDDTYFFPKEIASKKQWDSMTPEQQEVNKKRLQEISLIARLNKKGYAMMKKSKGNDKNTRLNEPETQNQGIMETNQEVNK